MTMMTCDNGSVRGRRRSLMTAAVGAATLGLVAAMLAATPVDAATPMGPAAAAPALRAEVEAPIPSLNWKPCVETFGDCTRALVPLDYDDPEGETVRIFMSRLPATDQDNKIGTLFINPGGPGSPASFYPWYFADLLGPEVSAHFDIVGIDPRGIGRSTGVRCQSNTPHPPYPRIYVPLNADQAAPLMRWNRWYSHACVDSANPILDHMTTADTARDMDLIRQALGEDQLSYYGISYGTYLGATYAAMFPDRVRGVVLDGVLDPIAWSTGRPGWGDKLPFSTRLRSGVGAWDALATAFAECDRVGKARCKFAGEAGAKWQRIIKHLKKGPAHVPGGRLFYSDVVSGALGPLYSRPSYRFLMRTINFLYRSMFGDQPTGLGKTNLVETFHKMARSQPGPYLSPRLAALTPHAAKARPIFPSFEGVACSDSVNPADPAAWLNAGAIADRQGPWFGRVWTWASGPCATWPGSGDDAFLGPWNVHTSEPVLLIGNFHDPATPISGARVVNTLFQRSRLISLNTWGHGALGASACVKARVSSYLVGGSLPPNGLVCQPNKQLFPQVP